MSIVITEYDDLKAIGDAIRSQTGDTEELSVKEMAHKISNIQLESSQSDWEQNDSTRMDYIKNRPFYHLEEIEEPIFDQDITFDIVQMEYIGRAAEYVFYPNTLPLINDELYAVYIDDNVFFIKGGRGIDFPYEYHDSIGQGIFFDANSITITNTTTITGCHLKICKATNELKQLDEKFIPDISKSVKSALANNTATWSENEKAKARDTLGVVQVQTDWNQMDDTKVDYIKNRPFYEYKEKGNHILSPEWITGYAYHFANNGITLENGKEYFIDINGISCIVECGTTLYLSDKDKEITNIESIGLDTRFINVAHNNNGFTFDMYECNNIVKQIDEKFIPELSGSVKDALTNSNVEWSEEDKEKAKETLGIEIPDNEQVQTDWEQNDETAPDYIKNRPFYEYEDNGEVLFDGDITLGIAGDAASYNFSPVLPLTIGSEYLVQINDTVLTLVCGEENVLDAPYNTTIGGSIRFSGHVISILYYMVNEISLKISTIGTGAVVKQIDNKFLPNNVVYFETEETLELPDIEDNVKIEVTDDGNGNVTLKLNGADITDDGNGNVTLKFNGVDIIDDGNGNVTLKSGNMTVTDGESEKMDIADDDNGNVTLRFTNVDITDDNNGNVTIKSENMEVTDDGNGNVKINI